MAVIFDIDGTLSDCTHRLHYVRTVPQHWEEFYSAMGDDPRIKPMVNLAIDLARSNRIILMTGRPEAYRQMTAAWLARHGVIYNHLYMRADRDFRPDFLIKKEMLDSVRIGGYPIDFAIDDSPAVIDMFNAEGILCLAMPKGKNT